MKIVHSLAVLLADREYLVGGVPSIADFSVAAQLDEILRTSEISGRIRLYTTIMEWLQRC